MFFKEPYELTRQLENVARRVRRAGLSVVNPQYGGVRHIYSRKSGKQAGAICVSTNNSNQIHVYFDQ